LIKDEVDRDKRWPWLAHTWADEGKQEELSNACDTLWLNDGVMFRYCLMAGETRVGGACLVRVDWRNKMCEIGYELLAQYEGKGYVSEAVKLLEHQAFYVLKLQRIELHIDARNLKSRGVAERKQYVLEGIHLKNWYNAGEDRFNDTCIYAKLRPDLISST
jgi:RimJ/RimL family protein N-acetyltransferase